MASNLFNRFVSTSNSVAPSIYETLRQYDDDSESDTEERAGMAVDEENLGDKFADYELEDALAHGSDTQSRLSSPRSQRMAKSRREPFRGKGEASSHWRALSPKPEDTEIDDEVPASLLIEGHGRSSSPPPPLPPPPPLRNSRTNENENPRFNPSRNQLHQQWQATLEQQPLHDRARPDHDPARHVWSMKHKSGLAFADPKDKAMWRWANVENLDNFLNDVYLYFLGNGIWSVVLNRVLNLLTLAFVVGFTTFLTNCIDYRKVPHSKTMSQILIPRCVSRMSAMSTFLLWLFTIFWIGKVFQYAVDFRRLRHMQDFYQYLLGISDADIQTVSWQEVVKRLMALRDANPATAGAVSAKHRRFLGSQSKQRMDAHDIANRLMRRENYLIALFNKDILDLTLPIPFLRRRQLFSRTLEWNLNLCILDYAFNEQGQLRPLFLKDTHRKALSEGLRRRFILAGVMNIFAAPFIVIYFLMHYFFRYFNEYQKMPSQIGSRQYTPLAEWKFREFNELWHLFERRTNMSHIAASDYIAQFPKDKTVQLSRFVAFIASALASVLALASVIDPELFLGFEITHDRTVLFYLGIFGTVWAVAQSVVPAENHVFDPELSLRRVIEFTHYQPAHWQGRLHSDEVKKEFAMLYQMKLVVFIEEILSMIFTPFVLWFSLPRCSDRLIDFFREFTVHVNGLGYVCSFAVFDFKKGNNVIPQGRDGPSEEPATGFRGLRDDYYSTKDGKMLASYYGFLDHYSMNPRAGVTHAYMQHHRRQQKPYPSFNNPPSPLDENNAESMHLNPPRQGTASFLSPTHRISRPEPITGEPASPLPSILLDPRHQPSASGFRSTNRVPGPSRARPTRLTTINQDRSQGIDENPDDEHAAGLSVHPQTTSISGGGATDESQLEDSWRMNLAADINNLDDQDEENIQDVVDGTGVLGLIHQFQKVSNEGRRAVGL